MKRLITATFIIMTAPFAFAGDCSTHSDQAMTCDAGTPWDATATRSVYTHAQLSRSGFEEGVFKALCVRLNGRRTS